MSRIPSAGDRSSRDWLDRFIDDPHGVPSLIRLRACLLALYLLLGSTVLAADKEPAAEDSITVTVVGTLRTGIFAIGGETTGTTITAKGITY